MGRCYLGFSITERRINYAIWKIKEVELMLFGKLNKKLERDLKLEK